MKKSKSWHQGRLHQFLHSPFQSRLQCGNFGRLEEKLRDSEYWPLREYFYFPLDDKLCVKLYVPLSRQLMDEVKI